MVLAYKAGEEGKPHGGVKGASPFLSKGYISRQPICGWYLVNWLVPQSEKIMGTLAWKADYQPMKLTIVIPAYNEEQAIESIIQRTLAAREHIVAHSPVHEVEIVVVSDGSTDRTAELAAEYNDIKLVAFEKNRGYGAAIKKGFEVGSGELVSFLDADGTCDPRFFAELCRLLVSQKADVAIGSRMHRQSEMPRIRRLGNRVYALLLSLLSNKIVSDSASGMRVIRRDVLPALYPLPDGLHFTPAMSARVLMDDQLHIVEQPMSYRERIGESKLHVVRDGCRFLAIILSQALFWKPGRMLALASGVSFLSALLTLAWPLETWLRNGELSASADLRVVVGGLLLLLGLSLLTIGAVSDRLRRLAEGKPALVTFVQQAADRLYSCTLAGPIVAVATLVAGWLAWPSVTASSGAAAVGPRLVLALLMMLAAGQFGLGAIVLQLLRYHEARKLRAVRPPEMVDSVARPASVVVATPKRGSTSPAGQFAAALCTD